MSSSESFQVAETVILDVDGTLVDTVFEHAVAWARAFQAVGVAVLASRLHATIGMGSEALVEHVAGRPVEEALGDEVRRLHDEEFADLAVRLRVLPGADEIISFLSERGHRVVVATSGSQRDTERALDMIPGAGSLLAVVTGGDVSSGKPSTDLLDVVMDRVGGGPACVVGDSAWDALAGRERGDQVIGLLTGGVPRGSLEEAGAGTVFATLQELMETVEPSHG